MKFKYFAFDLDGTIYKGNEPINETIKIVKHLQSLGLIIFYFTNNSASSIASIIHKLNNFGLNASEKNLYTSGYATVRFVKNLGINNINLIGSSYLYDEFLKNNLNIKSYLDVQAVVVGLDKEFSYKKMENASIALQSGAEFIACNLDSNFPVENNILLPGCGPIVKAIEVASGRSVNHVVGKPNSIMFDMLLSDWKINKNEIIVIGDSLESDVLMAKNVGVASILLGKERGWAYYNNSEYKYFRVKKMEEILKII